MLRRCVQSGYLPLLLCGVYAAVMAPLAPEFLSGENLGNVLVAMLPLMIVATGQTVVLITAGIDLSVTSIIALASLAGGALITADGGLLADSPGAVAIAVAAMLLVGGLIGAFNGSCIAWLGMPPFIVTLTTMMAVRGVAVWSTQSRSIYSLPDEFLLIGQSVWLTTAIAIGVAGTVQFLLSRTLLGLRLHAVGGNRRTAEVSGVPVARTTVLAYVISGLCAGAVAVLITGELETASPVQWENNLLDVIGATVIGGASLYGGRGNVFGTLCGVLLLTLIDNSLNLLNLSHFTIMMAKGGVILLAALLDAARSRTEAA